MGEDARHMTTGAGTISNRLLSMAAGAAAFILTLLGFLLLGRIDQQVVASLFIGLFALAVVRLAAERPNSGQARAMTALGERLLAVGHGDLASPAPEALRREVPAVAAAVDALFDQVRSTLDDAHALAMYDPVTALPNRIHFRREGDRILKARKPGEGAALLFIDLDGFKEVNDCFGHAHGDQVLILVANRLRAVVKAETDPDSQSPPILARLAGDEFTMLLPGVAIEAEAQRVAARALDALAEPMRHAGRLSRLSGSIGIALSPEHGTNLPELMSAADLAMYEAKARGRSRACLYGEAAEALRIERLARAS
jgi:diguanylate cyclase (GGDEF)-like protein